MRVWGFWAALCSAVLAAAVPAAASKLTVLHIFQSADGDHPMAGLIKWKGAYYGTTGSGGAFNAGTVFRITPAGDHTIAYSFKGGADGAAPMGELIVDGDGNFYGTTEGGGTRQGGTVYRIASDGTESVLHDFAETGDGKAPFGALVRDGDGNLYGTTLIGGAHNQGTIFKVAANGTESVLYSFGRSAKDGAHPAAGLVRDKSGNLFGVTQDGGLLLLGTVFELTAKGKEKIVYAFSRINGDGMFPSAPLVRGKHGDLYGTAPLGADGGGAVFKIASDGTQTVLHRFSSEDGCEPAAPVVLDGKGNLYGTTFTCGAEGGGTIYKIAPDGTFTKLYDFEVESRPVSGLFLDARGDLYGTTSQGGTFNNGIVFRFRP